MTFIPVKQIDGAERQSLVNTLRTCPVCLGTGEWDTPSNMGPGVPKCPICRGQGFVDMASICACGMPALFFKDNVLFCGRELCLNALKHRRPPNVGLGA